MAQDFAALFLGIVGLLLILYGHLSYEISQSEERILAAIKERKQPGDGQGRQG